MAKKHPSNTLLVECSTCEGRVEARILCTYEYPSSLTEDPYRICLGKCLICNGPFLVGQEFEVFGEEPVDQFWGSPKSLWPEGERLSNADLPRLVWRSLLERQKCFRAGAYDACAVMCGRALEAVCAEHQTNGKMLAVGLKELLDKGVIDKKMFDWGTALRKHRNIGAHATSEKISREDAKDLVEFVTAICEYVFVLKKKYDDFLTRQQKRKRIVLKIPSSPSPKSQTHQ